MEPRPAVGRSRAVGRGEPAAHPAGGCGDHGRGPLAEPHPGHGPAPGQPVRPTHVLFNGGVFKADVLRNRLLEVLGEWFPGAEAPQMLEGRHDLDHAVARGAAYYGWAKHRGGVRIRGGTARAYYVGIETAGLAVPEAPRPLRALCVVPHGMEEGAETDVPSDEIGLVVGEPAQFRFFSSSTRKDDRPGDDQAEHGVKLFAIVLGMIGVVHDGLKRKRNCGSMQISASFLNAASRSARSR